MAWPRAGVENAWANGCAPGGPRGHNACEEVHRSPLLGLLRQREALGGASPAAACDNAQASFLIKRVINVIPWALLPQAFFLFHFLPHSLQLVRRLRLAGVASGHGGCVNCISWRGYERFCFFVSVFSRPDRDLRRSPRQPGRCSRIPKPYSMLSHSCRSVAVLSQVGGRRKPAFQRRRLHREALGLGLGAAARLSRLAAVAPPSPSLGERVRWRGPGRGIGGG